MLKVPDRNDRKKCWSARDVYFECLNEHGLWLDGLKPENYEEILSIDPTKPPVIAKTDKGVTKHQLNTLFTCSKVKQLFKDDCLPSWFLHFSMLRVNELQKKEMFERLKEKDAQLAKDNKDFWNEQSKKQKA